MLKRHLQKVATQTHTHSGMMWKSVSCTLWLFISSQLTLWSVWVKAQEPDDEVKIEVLFKPEQCEQQSKKGDLMNVHYDGFLAKDGSQFYCRLVAWEGKLLKTLKRSICKATFIYVKSLHANYKCSD